MNQNDILRRIEHIQSTIKFRGSVNREDMAMQLDKAEKELHELYRDIERKAEK
jgi:hypothetical protein